MTESDRAETPADLVARVFDEEERRQREIAAAEAAQRGPAGSFDAEQLTLREGLQSGGVRLIGFIGLLGFVETLETSAFAVVAPDIQKSLDVSDATIGAIGGAFGILFLLGSIPLSSLADRAPRKLVVGAAMSLWAIVVMVTSTVSNAFLLFIARMGAGLGQSYYIPVAGPMLMDGYPIGARAKIFAMNGWFQMAGQALGPLLAGLIVFIASGDEGWRWVFITMGVMGVPLAIGAFFIREPRRGRHEMQAVLGEELAEAEDELPISLSVAFERLRKIRSFYYYLTGMAAIGFALFTTIIFINLYLEDHYGLTPFERGVFGSLTILPGFAGAAIAGKRADALFKDHPSRSMVFIGGLVVTFGAIQVIGLWMPTVWLFGLFFGHLVRVLPGRVRHLARCDRLGHPLPVAVPGHCAGGYLHVLVRRVLGRGAYRDDQRRHRRAGCAHHRDPAGHAGGRRAHGLRLSVHRRRHRPGHRGTARGAR